MRVGAVLGIAALIAAVAPGCGARTAQRTSAVTTTSALEVASDPCRGADLTLEAAMQHCRIEDGVAAAPTPSATDLVASLEPVEVASGRTARVWITLRNATARPLDVTLPAVVWLYPSIWRGDERVDERVVLLVGGMLAALSGCVVDEEDCRRMQVSIDPGGALRAYVDVAARVSVLRPASGGSDLDALELVDGGPIPPGEYLLRVALPFGDPSPAHGGTHVTREVRAPLTITP